MNFLKTITLTGLITLGAFTMVTYTSCSKDKCNISCRNNGTCVDGKCQCPTGFEGSDCSVLSSDKFVNMYQAVDECPLTDRTGNELKYLIIINHVDKEEEPNTLRITNLGNSGNEVALEGTVKGKELIVEEQEANGKMYSGTLTYLENGKLKATFNIKENGTVIESCISNLSKY